MSTLDKLPYKTKNKRLLNLIPVLEYTIKTVKYYYGEKENEPKENIGNLENLGQDPFRPGRINSIEIVTEAFAKGHDGTNDYDKNVAMYDKNGIY